MSGKATAGPASLDATQLSDWDYIREISHNDFEDVLPANVPKLWELIQSLNEAEKRLVRMTGSGSTIVAMPYGPASERDILERIRPFGATVIQSRTAEHVEPVQIIE
jgi:4-diphosphocytidyl-2C-methyl-D-erythritol kinase